MSMRTGRWLTPRTTLSWNTATECHYQATMALGAPPQLTVTGLYDVLCSQCQFVKLFNVYYLVNIYTIQTHSPRICC